MTLPLTLIIITGEIDLSVASILGLCERDARLPRAATAGRCGGPSSSSCCSAPRPALFNGLLITRLGLPSLAVTIGTLTLYRGFAVVILGPNIVSTFPERYTNIGINGVGGHVPLLVGRVLPGPRGDLRRRPAPDAVRPLAVRDGPEQGRRDLRRDPRQADQAAALRRLRARSARSPGSSTRSSSPRRCRTTGSGSS